MKKYSIAAILTFLLISPSMAIIGLGVHYNMAPGSGIDASSSSKSYTTPGFNLTAGIDQGKASGLQGFGLKLWLDFIPVVDIEVATNLKLIEYNVAVDLDDGGNNPH